MVVVTGGDVRAGRTRGKAWQRTLPFATGIVTLVSYLFYVWYAVADRYFIFLYFHEMGLGFDTTPFGWVTAGRYWMAGLVAGGAVQVCYLATNLVLGRLTPAYQAPVWWRVWLLSAIPSTLILPALTMTVNDPVLPLSNMRSTWPWSPCWGLGWLSPWAQTRRAGR
jgi:hypothetical protein